MELSDRTRINILMSCLGKEKKDFEPFVADHAIVFIINGQMLINDGQNVEAFNTGEVGFISKNQVIKATKIPLKGEEFRSVTIFLPRETLFSYAKEQGITSGNVYTGPANFQIPSNKLLKAYIQSMLPYFENASELSENLSKYKTMELIEVLIKDRSFMDILFNFEERYKIDLEAYMNRTYMRNFSLDQFARFSGRSLSGFKRDFQTIFHMTPNKWLIKKRLELAHYLIKAKGSKPSEVYLEVGFVNLSHFTRSFKAKFGICPSEI